MEWYYIVMLTGIYFVMGFGVSRFWDGDLHERNFNFIIVLVWPVVLVIAAFIT